MTLVGYFLPTCRSPSRVLAPTTGSDARTCQLAMYQLISSQLPHRCHMTSQDVLCVEEGDFVLPSRNTSSTPEVVVQGNSSANRDVVLVAYWHILTESCNKPCPCRISFAGNNTR